MRFVSLLLVLVIVLERMVSIFLFWGWVGEFLLENFWLVLVIWCIVMVEVRLFVVVFFMLLVMMSIFGEMYFEFWLLCWIRLILEWYWILREKVIVYCLLVMVMVVLLICILFFIDRCVGFLMCLLLIWVLLVEVRFLMNYVLLIFGLNLVWWVEV